MYAVIAVAEPAMRQRAVTKFPMDPWSADDDFHVFELQSVRDYARDHHFGLADVLDALDSGLRNGWPPGAAVPHTATVPPCRPRAIY